MKMKTRKEWIHELINVILGNFIVACGVTFFVLPSSILTGGTAGIAVALEPLVHLEPQLIINALTIGLFLIGSLCLGKAFFMKTVLSAIVYPLFISLLSWAAAGLSFTENRSWHRCMPVSFSVWASDWCIAWMAAPEAWTSRR